MPAAVQTSNSLGTEQAHTAHLRRLEAAGHRATMAYIKRVRRAELVCDTMVIPGVPFEVIISAAQTLPADLIIMGSNGHTGLKHLLLGSIAEQVVRLTPCPVLVVRDKEE